MPTDPLVLTQYLNASAEALKTEWGLLVRLALSLPEQDPKAIQDSAIALAFVSRAGTESIKRKLLAIQHARSCGLAPEEIMAQGQEVTVSTFNASKRTEQLDQKVWLQWKVSGALRELVQAEYTRICGILDFNTAEMFFEWLFAQLHDLSPVELKHAAGVPVPQQPVQRGVPVKGKVPPKPPVTRKSAAIEDQTDAGKDREGPEEPQAA